MYISSLALGIAAAASLAAPAQAQAQYSLSTTYDMTNFFTSFDFFTEKDPTKGFVEYVDRATAEQQALIGYGGASGSANSSIIMGVDHKTLNPANGRRSVRVTSQKSFTHGLFLADIAHMPGNICGVWPAYWMFGPNWPSSGEIDIIEGVNTQATGAVTLHTSPGCTMTNTGASASTKLKSADCGGGNASGGCGQQTADVQNYGDGFNDVRGGVYATEWTSDHIAVWFFQRTAIPADIASGQPNPAAWGPPAAHFLGGQGCDIDSHFANNQLVFDTTFCGDWAGNADVWAADATCSAKAASCNDYVANHPADFQDAFWEINSIKVYEQQAAGYQGKIGTAVPKAFKA